MGSVKEIKKKKKEEIDPVKAFCDDVYVELEGMRMRILTIVNETDVTADKGTEPFTSFRSHLLHLADQIEWQLQILSHSCPYDWKGSREHVQTGVSVPDTGEKKGPEFSGGYVGG